MKVRGRLLRCLFPALAFVLAAAVQVSAQEFNDPYSIMAPERGVHRHHAPTLRRPTLHAPSLQNHNGVRRTARRRSRVAHGSSGIVLPAPLPRTQIIPPEGGSAPIVRTAPQQQGTTVLPGVSPIPTLPHGPETFQDRASRCAFQRGLYNVPGDLGTQYMGACVQ
jgi:hypothetical protein